MTVELLRRVSSSADAAKSKTRFLAGYAHSVRDIRTDALYNLPVCAYGMF